MPRKKQADNSEEGGAVLSGGWVELQERLEQLRADRLMAQAQVLRGDLVPRVAFSSAMGNALQIYRTHVTEIDMALGATIGAVLGVPENEMHKLRTVMSEMAYNMVGEIVKKLEKFIKGEL